MFNQESAIEMANRIESVWNSKDMDGILSYFTDDVELTSTNVQRFFPDSNGIIKGKESVKNYWEYTIHKFPYFEYKLKEISFEENRLIMKFFNGSQQVESIGVISFNEEMKIYKLVTCFV